MLLMLNMEAKWIVSQSLWGTNTEQGHKHGGKNVALSPEKEHQCGLFRMSKPSLQSWAEAVRCSLWPRRSQSVLSIHSAIITTVKPQTFFREKSAFLEFVLFAFEAAAFPWCSYCSQNMEMKTMGLTWAGLRDEGSVLQTSFQKKPRGPEAERVTFRSAWKKVSRW